MSWWGKHVARNFGKHFGAILGSLFAPGLGTFMGDAKDKEKELAAKQEQEQARADAEAKALAEQQGPEATKDAASDDLLDEQQRKRRQAGFAGTIKSRSAGLLAGAATSGKNKLGA